MDTLPPGLRGSAQRAVSGAHPDYSGGWLSINLTKTYTNVFIWDQLDGKMLLGLKKRGFGVNLYNGFGGKVEPGESTLAAAKRELKEEADIEANLRHIGTILFQGEGSPHAHLVEVFSSNTFEGLVTESEEMRPQWFTLPILGTNLSGDSKSMLQPFPFERMWPDVKLWMPFLLSSKRFIGRVDYVKIEADAKEEDMAKWWFGIIPE